MFLLILKTLVLLTFLIGKHFALDQDIGQLPHCVDTEKDVGFLLVSTLDGTLTSIGADGNVLWDINTGPGPLLTSNIHNVELTNNGEWVRIIPSLTGSLYKFNGKTIDAIPINADNLLKSSFMYSNELVIAGGRDVRTYGIAVKDGSVIYECNLEGCTNKTKPRDEFEDIVVVERSTTTVRAHEPRTGSERWNFSVGYHNIKIPQASCINLDTTITTLNVTANLPKGILTAWKTGTHDTLWQHFFQTPIVKVWKWDGRDLMPIDLFTQAKPMQTTITASPAIYLGMHNKQLYIYESTRMMHALQVQSYHHGEVIESKSLTRIPWKPILANELEEYHDDSTALSVLYNSEYVNGNGYYFYTESDIEKTNTILCDRNTTKKHFKQFLSGTFYWKEIILSIASAVLINVIWSLRGYRLRRAATREIEETPPSTTPSAVNSVDSKSDRTFSESSDSSQFTSRYVKDFETVRCLGRGGFGTVFEVKQKIDECGYAIKRITLSHELESRDKVLREVKALAKLDHPNIVRYSTSWVEFPPPGWSNEYDQQWVGDMSDLVTESTEQSTKHRRSKSVAIAMQEDDLRHNKSDDTFQISFQDSSNDTINSRSEVVDEDTASTKISNVSTQNDETGRSSFAYLYIQMQLCRKESLKDWLTLTEERNRDEVVSIFNQILSAVEYIHNQKLIHRDLKPSNIFFSLEGNVKVGDFGLVTTMKNIETEFPYQSPIRSHTKGAGTYFYMSPEQTEGKEYDYRVDIFSLGVILFELLVPFGTEMERNRTLNDLRIGKYPKGFSLQHNKEYDLLKKMLAVRPMNRPDAPDIRRLINKTEIEEDEESKESYSLPVNVLM